MGAAFDSDLLSKMYAMITKLLPESFHRNIGKDEMDVGRNDGDRAGNGEQGKQELGKMFPGLAMRNEGRRR